MLQVIGILVVAAACSVGALAAVRYVTRLRQRSRRGAFRSIHFSQATRRFHLQRERLEAKFIQLAAAHAGPNVPRWADCAFADDVSYVRNRTTGELTALVAVTITPEDAHHDAAAIDPQAGTALFRFDYDRWETDGRAILNLTPSEAVRHFNNDFEMVGEELAHHS